MSVNCFAISSCGIGILITILLVVVAAIKMNNGNTTEGVNFFIAAGGVFLGTGVVSCIFFIVGKSK
mgnify:CR=1 FL=1